MLEKLEKLVELARQCMHEQSDTVRDIVAIVRHIHDDGKSSPVTLRGIDAINRDILNRINTVDSLYFRLAEYAAKSVEGKKGEADGM